eukprot:TRINITY_DN4473_c0_g1_i2.p1 TRINITY_DN4473_c0_g1~~TRINITY_DN4473_c0_g1_i2.p1  ORF type:complete len:851 (+),score=326.08 TRINITY_DN4473_c0_g1_i2:148-2553(+)
MAYQAETCEYGALERVAVSVIDAAVESRSRRKRGLLVGLAGLGAAVVGIAAVAGYRGRAGFSAVLPPADSATALMAQANFNTAQHPMSPDAALWGNVQRPYPTGAWWLNFALPGEPQPAVAYPYAVKARPEGPLVSYSATRRLVEQKIFADIFAPDLSITTASPAVAHYVDAFDQLSVTETYETENGGSYKLLFVKGSPYVTFEFTNCQVQLKPLALFSAVNGEAPVNWRTDSAAGTQLKLELSSGQTWLLFTSEEVTYEYNNMQLAMTAPFTGVLRAAVLLHPKDEALLAQYAPVYPTGGDVAWSVEDDTMFLSYQWKTSSWTPPAKKHAGAKPSAAADAAAEAQLAETAAAAALGEAELASKAKATQDQLLMLALPHHMDVFAGKPQVEEGLAGKFKCIKGAMTPIIGTTWEMQDKLPGIEWHSTAGADLDELLTADILEQARLDVKSVPPVAPDPYAFGKALGRLARIALITDQLGDNETSKEAADALGPYLAPWLDGENPDALLYDTAWGGVVSKRGLEDEMEDFGNGWYNDHHFHYGYFIYGAAVAIKYDPSFYTQYRRQLELLVADIANTQTDSDLFPFARHKDMYDFHSWASGLFPQSNGKSQESISEAINAYYAVHLYGVATKNDALRDWGRVLAQMELRAGHTYWQMPSGTPIYDSNFASNKMAGVVGALDVICNTWFGDKFEYIHAINMMPFTPITEALLRPPFVAEEYPVLARALAHGDGVAQEWLGFVYMDQAIVDPDQSWADLLSLRIFDSGNSLTNGLYWSATRPKHDIAFAKAPAASSRTRSITGG